MGWCVAGFAEIVHRAHDSLPEVMLPEAVHHDARCQRVFRTHHPFGELQRGRCLRLTAACFSPATICRKRRGATSPRFLWLPRMCTRTSWGSSSDPVMREDRLGNLTLQLLTLSL